MLRGTLDLSQTAENSIWCSTAIGQIPGLAGPRLKDEMAWDLLNAIQSSDS